MWDVTLFSRVAAALGATALAILVARTHWMSDDAVVRLVFGLIVGAAAFGALSLLASAPPALARWMRERAAATATKEAADLAAAAADSTRNAAVSLSGRREALHAALVEPVVYARRFVAKEAVERMSFPDWASKVHADVDHLLSPRGILFIIDAVDAIERKTELRRKEHDWHCFRLAVALFSTMPDRMDERHFADAPGASSSPAPPAS